MHIQNTYYMLDILWVVERWVEGIMTSLALPGVIPGERVLPGVSRGLMAGGSSWAHGKGVGVLPQPSPGVPGWLPGCPSDQSCCNVTFHCSQRHGQGLHTPARHHLNARRSADFQAGWHLCGRHFWIIAFMTPRYKFQFAFLLPYLLANCIPVWK